MSSFLQQLQARYKEGQQAKKVNVEQQVSKYLDGIEQKLLDAAFRHDYRFEIKTELLWPPGTKNSKYDVKEFCEITQAIYWKLSALVEERRVKMQSRCHGSIYGCQSDRSDTVDFLIDLSNLEERYR